MYANPQDLRDGPEPLRRIRLQFASACCACGRELPRGANALHDPGRREVRCLACAPRGDEAAASTELLSEPLSEPRPEPLPQPLPQPEPLPQPDLGTAGASARREYERLRGNREERIRDRFGRRLGGLVLAVTDEPQSTRAWATGARGEEALAQALSDVPGVIALHDRRVPGTRANIDHIVVGPTGLFVVDAKRYTGQIHLRDVGGLFRSDRRLYVGRRDCSDLTDAVASQVAVVEAALEGAGIEPLPAVTPVLCFVDGDWPLFRPPDSFRGVRLESPRSLCRLVGEAQDTALDVSTVTRLVQFLATALPAR
jgi:hypothetical protein